MDCYRKFAHIYDELINEDIDYQKWCDKIIDICKQNNIKCHSYLDLACGTGNVTEKVGRFFNEVWAVDLSTDMLVEAEEKMRAQGIKANFVCQDISKLQLNRKFDLITCCLDSTNYLLEEEQLINYFKGVQSSLKDEGLFIFDINSYYKLTEILGNNTFIYDGEEVFYAWENELEDDIVHMYLNFFIRDGQVYSRFDENHMEKAYKEEYIEEILKNIGFNIVGKYDNYICDKINDNTERIVYIVKKNI
ncbi:class I SAM-dependent DNA methyltransferase [Haloimpatiens lingqiaonensis]|uniref:class I SAM-dependent DNA methyltransferase n=1 Tax=Haloimpatiens lingqiaonensis TaxID=1380675 RepID=UPI0010FE8F3B|nr:class I SAM-dependent methyltransferase [Haloimpatiens lingqiaonensis]